MNENLKIKILEASSKYWCHLPDNQDDGVPEVHFEKGAEWMYTEMEEVVEALEFYACSKNYNSTAPYGAGITHPTLIFEDDGYKARKALEELKK